MYDTETSITLKHASLSGREVSTGVFFHSVVYGLVFFICFMKHTSSSVVLYSDETCVFDQSVRAQGYKE